MEIIDIIILIFAGLMVILGFRKGLIISLATLVALVLGIYLAVHFSNFAADFLKSNFDTSATYLPVLSFSITFLVVLIGVLFLGKLIEKVVKTVGLGFLNHLTGAILGLVKSVLILSVAFWVIAMADPGEKLITPKAKHGSLFYKHIEPIVPKLIEWSGAKLEMPEVLQ